MSPGETTPHCSRFFTGRVHQTQCQRDSGAIDDELWGTYIDTAEKLLISAHAPQLERTEHLRDQA